MISFGKNLKASKLFEYQNTFSSLKEDEPETEEIKNDFLYINEIRTNMTKWLVFLCDSLNFNIQTLFRSVIIFDKFLSTSKFSKMDMTQEKLNLITIACLSLGTKLEEINCNYVSFLTEKVLNLPECRIFTVKDLTKMEMTVLKELKYKTLYTTAVDFNLLYIKVFGAILDDSLESNILLQNIKMLSENFMKQNIISSSFTTMSQSDFASLCFNQSFIQLGLVNCLNIKPNTKNPFDFNMNDKLSQKTSGYGGNFNSCNINIITLSSLQTL